MNVEISCFKVLAPNPICYVIMARNSKFVLVMSRKVLRTLSRIASKQQKLADLPQLLSFCWAYSQFSSLSVLVCYWNFNLKGL